MDVRFVNKAAQQVKLFDFVSQVAFSGWLARLLTRSLSHVEQKRSRSCKTNYQRGKPCFSFEKVAPVRGLTKEGLHFARGSEKFANERTLRTQRSPGTLITIESILKSHPPRLSIPLICLSDKLIFLYMFLVRSFSLWNTAGDVEN